MVDDFGQKHRNRAIDITDVAIAKVPKTKFNGFSNENNIFIQERHKEVLRLAKELNIKFQTNEMEVGILIDLHSWNYWIIEGKRPREIKFEDNGLAYSKLVKSYKNQLMFMHNYPRACLKNAFCKILSQFASCFCPNSRDVVGYVD